MVRRAAGEGHVRFRKEEKLWEARLYVPKKLRPLYDGKSYLSFYSREQSEALDKRAQAKKDMDEGKTSPKELTVGKYLERWLDGPAAQNRSARTYEDYEKHARRYLIPRIGSTPLGDLTAETLDNLYGTLSKEGLGARTVNHIHSTIRVALGRAVKQRLIPYNPARDAEPPRYSTAEREYATLSRGDVAAFFEALKGDRFEAFFVAAVLAGPRPAELRALAWKDLTLPDEGAGEARIRRTVSEAKEHGMFIRNATKTGKGRSIYLFPEVVAALRAHKSRQNEERLRHGSLWVDQGLVFPSTSGGIMDGRHLSRRHLKPALERAGLSQKTRAYDLRHTFATLWLDFGEDPKVLQDILGHSRIETTMNLYQHVSPKIQKDAFERFGTAFREGGGGKNNG